MSSNIFINCPICNDKVEKLVYRFHFEGEQKIIDKIKFHNPSWTATDGICSRCIDYYQTQLLIEQQTFPEIGPYFPIKSADDFLILPTGLRLDVDQQYSGRGVGICFIDSGFYPHPDLVSYSNRIKAIVDIPDGAKVIDQESIADGSSKASAWHGTMTSVVCAGDGYLSKGLYKGIANEAHLVLLQVQDSNGKITTGNIVNALNWVRLNFQLYSIKIVNMSVGADEVLSFRDSQIDQLVEELFARGITIVAAVGNDENGEIKPPANSPNVIAIGGIDDENQIQKHPDKIYHSTFGRTVDGLMKPDLLAPAVWVTAPILPGSRDQIESACLHELLECEPGKLSQALINSLAKTDLGQDIINETDVNRIRQVIIGRIQQKKYISPHYMHVDGTSFAAPIVSSVIAQMLEADPDLTPAEIREALFKTARRIENLPVERQGYGIVQPRKALFSILKKRPGGKKQLSPVINKMKSSIEFYVRNECASQISLAGSFNHWAQDVLLLRPELSGVWKIEIPMLPAGRYSYKFFVDDRMWMEDVDNPYREPDGFSGFNSILTIEN